MKVENILVIAFILTLLSGLYRVNRPFIRDAVIVDFGFPFHWLEAGRSTWYESPLRFVVLWKWFIVDFAIYGLLVATAMCIYEKTLKQVGKPKIYRSLFWLSSVALVVCCWIFISWTSILPAVSLFRDLLQPGSYNYSRVESFLRFLLGVMTIVFTWFLIKHFKESHKTIDSLISLNKNIKQDEVNTKS